ncbi:MAG: hypothetical protein Q9174_005300 [Haloplaca sp. 1 TL-2023]
MPETAALAALVVAAVALVIASAQLAQQVFATAYVIRKCDRIVTGGLTKGGTRQWHWRQFRFTVKYQTAVFSLPYHVYDSLGINCSVRVGSPAGDMWQRAVKQWWERRNPAQACWVSFVQDLAACNCLGPRELGTREESGDRIPDDLTVAPTRVDSITILLSCVALGMQVYRYSPTTGEITISGKIGSISSSAHPVLGGLVHYSDISDPSIPGWLSLEKQHSRALRQSQGVWANAVFGRFRDITYRTAMIPLMDLMRRQVPILQANGWPETEGIPIADSIHGAACFMALGHVDVSEVIPPSVSRLWAAHFAETIVKSHQREVFEGLQNPVQNDGAMQLQDSFEAEKAGVEMRRCSSPYSGEWVKDAMSLTTLIQHMETRNGSASHMMSTKSMLNHLGPHTAFVTELRTLMADPSSYCPLEILWDQICAADAICRRIPMVTHGRDLDSWANKIIVNAISQLANDGPPSWGFVADKLRTWPLVLATACNEVLDEVEDTNFLNSVPRRQAIRLLAQTRLLRSAYVTVMMRAAPPLGPGLDENSPIETSLAYMA